MLSDSETRLSGGGEERTREGRAMGLTVLDAVLPAESEDRTLVLCGAGHIHLCSK